MVPKIGQKQGPISSLLGSLTHDRATLHGQCSLTMRALNNETLSFCLAILLLRTVGSIPGWTSITLGVRNPISNSPHAHCITHTLCSCLPE